MQEMTMTPATAILIVGIIAWLAWALRRLFRRGLCDCGDRVDCKSGSAGGCSGCCQKCECADSNKPSACCASKLNLTDELAPHP